MTHEAAKRSWATVDNRKPRVMTAALTYLRGRPWLAACVLMMAIGLGLFAINRHGYLLTHAGNPFWPMSAYADG